MTDPIGKFQVLGELGQGAHSKILQIRREADQRQYALKVVPLEDKEDLKYLAQAQLELRVAQMLNHPNLIKVYVLEQIRDWLFRVKKAHLLIEYVNGKPLDQVKGLTVPRLVQVFEKIAAGLYHMHRRGVYHADLKPNNIMLSKAGEVKIIDFGLAWIKDEPKDRVQGTPEYMAPEQVKHNRVNEGSDIYNFGATMYRLTTWQHPPNMVSAQAGPGMNSKLFKNLLKPVKDLAPKTPTALCNLIEQCLAYKAEQRPQNAKEIQEMLQKMAAKLILTPEDGLEGMEW